MKGIFNALIILLLVGVGFYYWNNRLVLNETERFADASIPLYFEYPTGEKGYELVEQPPTDLEPTLLKRLVLMDKADYQSILKGERDNGEGPPAITIQVFSNPTRLSVMEWIEQNPGQSNFPLLIGEFGEANVAGINGVFYEADGLYVSRNTVFIVEDKTYMVSGSFLDRDSAIYRDYETIRSSITLEQ